MINLGNPPKTRKKQVPDVLLLCMYRENGYDAVTHSHINTYMNKNHWSSRKVTSCPCYDLHSDGEGCWLNNCPADRCWHKWGRGTQRHCQRNWLYIDWCFGMLIKEEVCRKRCKTNKDHLDPLSEKKNQIWNYEIDFWTYNSEISLHLNSGLILATNVLHVLYIHLTLE